MKKRFLTSAICGLCVLGFAATAFAVPVTLQTQQWYEWGRLYDLDTDILSPTFGDFVAKTGLGNDNPYDNSGTQNLTAGVYEGVDGTEDSWGIAQATGIFETGNPTNSFYDITTASKELTMFYSNGDDVYAQSFIDPTVSQILSEGFVARLYLDADWDYNPANNYAGRGLDNDGNAGADFYAGATEGTMVLELTGHTRYQDYSGTEANDDDSYQLDGTGNYVTGDVSGQIFLDVTGGTWETYYNTDTWDMTPYGGYGTADFRLKTGMLPNIGATQWNLEGVGTAQGDVIPEPATMLLLGTGLVGVAGAARRRKEKNQA